MARLTPPDSSSPASLEALPSLNALRAFDVAARFESASRAAEALHVTHGATEKQNERLERNVAVEMLRRALAEGVARTVVLAKRGVAALAVRVVDKTGTLVRRAVE